MHVVVCYYMLRFVCNLSPSNFIYVHGYNYGVPNGINYEASVNLCGVVPNHDNYLKCLSMLYNLLALDGAIEIVQLMSQ